jgi:hypothetical protein
MSQLSVAVTKYLRRKDLFWLMVSEFHSHLVPLLLAFGKQKPHGREVIE